MTDEDRIDDLLDEWEAAMDAGRDIPAIELCCDHPELQPQVEKKILQLKKLNGFLSDETEVTSSSSNAPRKQPADDISIESQFSLSQFLDQGGLGTVYVGYDKLLRREAAIKFLRQPHAGREECVKQFKTECEITSRLDHPSVVPIYGHGTLENGQPYYVMRRITGQTMSQRAEQLHEKLTARRPKSAERLELHSLLSTFVAVCRTIHYAHCRGVIHRDLKPANIMLGKHGETTVLDWGLAQTIARDENHQLPQEETLQVTRNALVDNSQIGTPIYMSPEQHAGTESVGVHSDVYSLGATMFVLLAGGPPFEADSLVALRSKVMRGETVDIKQKYAWMPRALTAICEKAMATDPKARYTTALDMAQDVERYLADEPVSACPDNFVRKAGRWLSRHRFKSFAIGTLLLATVLGSLAYSAIVTKANGRERAALKHANLARERSMKLAAGFAANSVALKMSERWRILEIVTQDDELIELLANVPERNEDVDWPAFKNKLMDFKTEFHAAAGSPDSWFICDANGRQVARAAPKDSIGKNYAHRDYFHGMENETPTVEDGTPPPHITAVHRSKVYVSSSTGQLKVALTRPIWSQADVNPNRKFLGVLGMSVSLGEFTELETNVGTDEIIMVVDTTENVLRDQSLRGLILHHPQMQISPDAKPVTVDSEMLKETEAIRNQVRSQLMQNARVGHGGSAQLLKRFLDPLSEDGDTNWVAAFAPVVVNGRPIEIADTGWGVIVAERN